MKEHADSAERPSPSTIPTTRTTSARRTAASWPAPGRLALAFDFNLATFGFPFPQDLTTPQEIADWVATTTSIGEDGSYLKDVTAKGRFPTFAYPGKGFQPQLGEVVLTTCNPDKKKKRSVDEVVDMLLNGRSICLVFGAGPKGVPKDIHEMAPTPHGHHVRRVLVGDLHRARCVRCGHPTRSTTDAK